MSDELWPKKFTFLYGSHSIVQVSHNMKCIYTHSQPCVVTGVMAHASYLLNIQAVRMATQYAATPQLPQWAPKRLTLPSRPKHSSMFPRCPLQLPDALTRRWVKWPGDLDLLTLKVVSESRVMWATSVPICLPRPLCSRLRPDIRDRQTSDKSIA